jgi:hypothetical protein
MKRDWLNIFLPIWALGSVAWVIVGFVLLPQAFRKPLLYSSNAVWTTTLFDLTHVDMEVARALAIVLGPPGIAITVALTIVAIEQIWGHRRPQRR